MPFRKNTGRPKERLTFCKGAEIRNAGKEGKKGKETNFQRKHRNPEEKFVIWKLRAKLAHFVVCVLLCMVVRMVCHRHPTYARVSGNIYFNIARISGPFPGLHYSLPCIIIANIFPLLTKFFCCRNRTARRKPPRLRTPQFGPLKPVRHRWPHEKYS